MRQSQGRDKSTSFRAAAPPAVSADGYPDLHRRFGWQVPEYFNMAQVCSRRWAENTTTARQTVVIATGPAQQDRHHRYAELQEQACLLYTSDAADE